MCSSSIRKFLGISALMLFIVTPGITWIATAYNSPDMEGLIQDEQSLVGNWKGESLCQVKDSPCHDEKVVYRISKVSAPDKVTIDADKIVDGKSVNMGTLEFNYDKATGALTSETKQGVWKFTVKGNQMNGTLTQPDGTLYRRVSLKKDR